MENKIMNENEVEAVQGGAANQPVVGWEYAHGTFVNYGNYIVYTVASGDVLSGIAIRFNVTVAEIAQWNNLKNPDFISVGQKLTIYARAIR